MLYKSRLKSQNWAGESIGILVVECFYPFLPGNVVNANSYNFPVRFALVEGGTPERLLYQADMSMLDAVIAGAKKLEAEGVRAIVCACGFFALFHKQVRDAVNIPVMGSSLLQVPFIHQITGKRVGIVTADSSCLKPVHFENTAISPDIPVAIEGLETSQAFHRGILENVGELDDDAICEDVVKAALRLVEKHDDIGAILLECSDTPRYAHAVQAATGLPVFDFTTMIDYVHNALTRVPFKGTM
jgi:Asp/Glu/hydantoin racemase